MANKMIIGITGTLGSGKGEEWEGTHSARGCQIFFEVTKKNIVNLNRASRAPAPVSDINKYLSELV